MATLPETLTGEQAEALADGAADFLMSGGVVSLSDWAILLPCERAAFALGARMASAVGDAKRFASEGKVAAAAEALAPIDGGASDAQLRCDAAADMAARMLSANGAKP